MNPARSFRRFSWTVPGGSPASSEAKTSRMEIIARSGRRVIVDADVDPVALARLLEVLEGR